MDLQYIENSKQRKKARKRCAVRCCETLFTLKIEYLLFLKYWMVLLEGQFLQYSRQLI